MNGQQNPLPTLAVATSTLVFVVEGIAALVAQPTFARLTAATLARLLAAAVMVYVPYFI